MNKIEQFLKDKHHDLWGQLFIKDLIPQIVVAIEEYNKLRIPIELTESEKLWILLCKGQLKTMYPFKSSWIETLKGLFIELYSWNPDEDNNYHDYLNCIFRKLMDLQLKINDDASGSNNQLYDIFNSSFFKKIGREDELPIERAIASICSLIQNNQVIVNGFERYSLKIN